MLLIYPAGVSNGYIKFEKNIKNYNEQSVKKEIASTSLDEMSEEEIKKEFENITI